MQPIINTLLDPVVNFGKVTVSGGYPAGTGNIAVTLIVGEGSKLPNPADPAGSFNLVWFDSSTYSDPADDPKVEIVRCIANVNDTLTLMRAQEGTSGSTKNTSGKIYKMILSPTKKTIDDIGVDSQSKVNTHSALSTSVHGVGADTIDGVSTRNIAISTHSSVTSNVHGFDVSGNAPAQIHGISKHTGTIGDHQGNLTGVGTNTHAQIDAYMASGGGGMTDILAGLSPVAAGWTVNPSPLGELTNANYTNFATPGYTYWATNEGSKEMTLTWDFGQLKPVTLIVWSGSIQKTTTTTQSYSLSVQVWDESNTWFTLDTFAYPGGGTMNYVKLLNPYTQISKIRISIVHDNGPVGMGITITFHGRRLCAYM